MANIKLQKGFATSILDENINENSIDVNIHMLHTGFFTDMNGTDVEITEETLNNLCTAYNKATREAYDIDKNLIPEVAGQSVNEYDNRNAPNQVNHNTWDAWDTVGNVIGLMEIRALNEKHFLCGKVRVKGKENVARVKDKRWRNVSIQYNPETYEFVEISWVTFGAAGEARHMMSLPHHMIEKNKMSCNFLKSLDIIRQKHNEILALDKEIKVTKKLISLIQNGSLSRAQMMELKPHLLQQEDSLKAIKLMEYIMPNKFKPYIIKNKEVIAMLQKETIMASTTEDRIQFTDALDALKAKIALRKGKKLAEDKADKDIEESDIEDDVDLAAEDEENSEKLKKKKLAAEEDEDTEKYADEESDEEKKLTKKKAALEKDRDMELSKYKKEMSVMFSQFKNQQSIDMKMITDAFVSLAELIKGDK
jgi:hypothetical protein